MFRIPDRGGNARVRHWDDDINIGRMLDRELMAHFSSNFIN